MPQHITEPATVPVASGKRVDQYVGRVRSGTGAVSVARMGAPAGWAEPAQERTASIDWLTGGPVDRA